MAAEAVAVDIAVCTFRRAELAATLASLGALAVPPGVRLGVIVADNDTTPSARSRVERAAAGLPFPVRYVHCPAGNISLARNACLDASSAPFLAFIDDDETATPGWLAALFAVAGATKADVVLGPVRALYSGREPGWMRRGDFHSTFPVFVHGEIRTGYTCNVLMRVDRPALAGRRFDLALGRSGGEDTDFFTRVREAGGRIAFASEAWVEEVVPQDRARFGWLARRRFRSGQTHGRLLAERSGASGRLGQLALALAKSLYCLAAGAVALASRRRAYAYLLRGVMHLGVVSGLVGLREIRQYGIVGART